MVTKKVLLIPLAFLILMGVGFFFFLSSDTGSTLIQTLETFGSDQTEDPIYLRQLSSGGVAKDSSNSLSAEDEETVMLGLSGWTQNGSEVYFEDEWAYISATDQTFSPIIRLISKNYTGDINIAFGFDTQEVKPTWAGYNRHDVNTTFSYTCDYEFNYTVSPKHYWCFETIEANATHNGSTTIVSEGDFEWGNIPLKTAYWTKNVETWDEVSGAFDKVTFFLNNTDTWYIKKNFGVVINETYELKLQLQQDHINTDPTKYWIAFWPSSKNISQAIADDKFWALDPWTPDLTTGLIAYYPFDEGSGLVAEDTVNANDGALTNMEGDEWTTSGKNNDAINFTISPDNTECVLINDTNTLDTIQSLSFWHDDHDTSLSVGSRILFSKGSNTDPLQMGIVWEDDHGEVIYYDDDYGKVFEVAVTQNTQHHYAITMSGTNMTLYVDGSQVDTGTLDSATMWDSANNLVVGGACYNTRGLTGQIDELAIWDITLNGTQVSNLATGVYYEANTDASPETTFVSPANASTYSTSPQNIDHKCNAQDDINLVNVTFYLNQVLEQTNSSGLNATEYTFSESVTDGYYNWTCIATDNSSQTGTTGTRWYTIDSIDPVLSVPYNISNITTFALPTNSSWHFNATDPHIDSCYYNTTEDASYQVITCNSTVQTEWATEGWKSIQFCANDTFAHETCNTSSLYIYSITDGYNSDKDSVSEGFDVTFNLTVNLTNTPLITANLTFNNTLYAPDTIQAGTNGYYFEKTVNVPVGWGSPTGVDKAWNWNYTVDGLASNVVGDSDNVTVYTLALDDCSSYPVTVLNMTLRDEEDQDPVNETAGANVEVDIDLTSLENSSITLEYFTTFTNENNPRVCIPSINASQYTIDLTVGYSSTDHVWEFFYIDNGTLNSSEAIDGQTTKTISLNDLLTADSTSFLFNYFDQDGLPVENTIVHVFRQYIGDGVFKEVERAKADQNGDTIVHLVEEDVIYYFMITRYGEILYTSSTYTALCQATPCTIQIEAGGQTADFPTDWDQVSNGAYELYTSRSTREVNLTYSLNSSSTMNMTVYKYESDGSYSVVNTTSDTGSSGSFLMDVPLSAGNVSFFAVVYQDDEFVNSEWVDMTQKSSDYFGTTLSLFLAGLIILTFGLMAVSSGAGTLVWVVLGVFISGALGLVSTGLSTGLNIVVYLIVAGGIFIWKLSRRRD